MKFDKYKQWNVINDIWEPTYHNKTVKIDIGKIKRNKRDIKLVFPKVNETSEYFGEWWISHKKAMSYRTTYNNNGLDCKVIPFEAFKKIEYSENSVLDLY